MKNHITPKELEIIILVSQGLSNQEIATQLRIEAVTVKVHLNHILSKLELRNRAQLIVYYYTTITASNRESI